MMTTVSELTPLKRIVDFLSSNSDVRKDIFWIPAIWNVCGYREILEEREGEIKVAAFDFFARHLKYIEGASAAYSKGEAANLDESIIYSSLLRYSTAWDYDHDGEIESGTFLRMMLLLPLLKEMGVNILYVLPVTRYSQMHLKGDIGSPYAVQSLFELDPNLHDELLEGMEQLTIHDEFAALVEACHLLDIRVTVDFIPRVTARNSEVILEHPDWVYWMRKDAFDSFRLPHIPELAPFEECTPDKVETVYRSKETAPFLEQFSQPPNVLNPQLWSRLQERAKETGEEILTLVENEMGITTSPAHSDWVNDTQPIWTDITFLRLYHDFAPHTKSLIKPDQAPYVLFDTIKCNYYPAERPNRELWDYLINAIHFNLDTYGIDGFRIDIGHVLPIPLLEEIFGTIKAKRPGALLISEDLFNRNHRKAAKSGYNIMLGSGWNVMTEITKENLLSYIRDLPELEIHIFACAETADTPRITSRGGVGLARMIGVFNGFLPNAIPFIATGFELNEEQPMNCGLGDNTNGAEVPRAFFNEMTMNWKNAEPMIPLLAALHACKQRWLELLKPDNFFVAESPENVLIYGYRKGDEALVGCFNLSSEQSVILDTAAWIQSSEPYYVAIDSAFGSPGIGERLERVSLAPNQALILTTHR
ncbi:Alpha-1,4-glucan:maltose-1-phosphate maltosyltransferase [Paenibacillus plantiphilus]|uniref:Alpha-1,4-glucan:maltose-1-phosphate maltosyltransferase n=1 Tax=Paenibacillus plantiphilus TaxID=2905650 RepID=A0ABN8GL13_9BACL|nr:alpha-amylase [Paenibacillus plantiphilus]CAH1208073.1 Alpha-1,4-glucan:maltose-1-phosphate maltosyltransferase [Paenibacillus plantiphilus]